MLRTWGLRDINRGLDITSVGWVVGWVTLGGGFADTT